MATGMGNLLKLLKCGLVSHSFFQVLEALRNYPTSTYSDYYLRLGTVANLSRGAMLGTWCQHPYSEKIPHMAKCVRRILVRVLIIKSVIRLNY